MRALRGLAAKSRDRNRRLALVLWIIIDVLPARASEAKEIERQGFCERNAAHLAVLHFRPRPANFFSPSLFPLLPPSLHPPPANLSSRITASARLAARLASTGLKSRVLASKTFSLPSSSPAVRVARFVLAPPFALG
jgi:hypothetical protein